MIHDVRQLRSCEESPEAHATVFVGYVLMQGRGLCAKHAMLYFYICD